MPGDIECEFQNIFHNSYRKRYRMSVRPLRVDWVIQPAASPPEREIRYSVCFAGPTNICLRICHHAYKWRDGINM